MDAGGTAGYSDQRRKVVQKRRRSGGEAGLPPVKEQDMRKYMTGMLMAVFAFVVMLPLQVRAGEQEALYLETDGEGVRVRLTLPGADGELLSSLSLSLHVTSDAAGNLEASFQFDPGLSGKAVVQEARYQAETGNLNLYIAGREPLFAKGEETITLGKVTASGGAFTVEAEEDSLTFAEGSSKRTVKLDRLPEPALAGGMEAPGTAVPEGGTGETAAPADTENLRQFVNTVKGYSKKNYTAESWAALEEAVKNAEGILNNPNASNEERDAALQALQNAAGALEDQTPDSAQLKAEQNQSPREKGLFKEPVPVILYVMSALLLLVVIGITVYGIKYKKETEIIYK